jgi:hypothetical protein
MSNSSKVLEDSQPCQRTGWLDWLSEILSPGVAKKMSSKDKESLSAFLPEYAKAEAMSSVIL